MKLVTLADAFVILILSAAVVLGLYVMPGCTAANFDTVESEYAAPEDVGSGIDRDPSADTGEDVSQQEASKMDAQSDSRCVLCDASIEETSETSVVSDTAKAETTPPGVEHRTATDETYFSALPSGKSGSYSPALFAETISKIESFHPGAWSAPYETKCDLSSEGHSLESCQTITTSSMGIVICPFGISYVNSFASCPPADAKVTWW